MIDTEKELSEFLRRLQEAEWLALDMEADSLHSYPEKVCLLQISAPRLNALIDPLADIDLEPLWEVLRGRELIMHGADYDLRLFHRKHDFIPTTVFDTMFAARLVGLRDFGLCALAANELGVKLEKGSQRANWSRRPLTPKMVAYAINDSRYLHSLAGKLRKRLNALGRIDWHRQMCAQLIVDATRTPGAQSDGAWRLKGSDRLTPREQAILRELWKWRERLATKANRPPFFVLSHDRLLAVAETSAAGGDYAHLIPKRYTTDRRTGLIEAVDRGKAVPEAKLPLPRVKRGRRMTAGERARQEELCKIRDAQAARLDLDATLIASKSKLGELACDWKKHSAEILPWQRELLQGV